MKRLLLKLFVIDLVLLLIVASILLDVSISVQKSELSKRLINIAVKNFDFSQFFFKRAYAIEQIYGNDQAQIPWGDLGTQLTASGAIDEAKLEALYKSRGESPENIRHLLHQQPETALLNENTASDRLILLWAVGLANYSPILSEDEMTDPNYGGVESLASVGGWTIANNGPMDHFGKHELIKLSTDQTQIVRNVSKNIFRPCCDNPTHFPDCNHGMAMLGLLELLASRGAGETELYRSAFIANRYWFENDYDTLVSYISRNEMPLKEITTKSMLGEKFSSGSGLEKINQILQPSTKDPGPNCSV